MVLRKMIIAFLILFCLSSIVYGETSPQGSLKKRILIVDSYHREYLWSQQQNEGLCAALLKFGYFDNNSQMMTSTSFYENNCYHHPNIVCI